MSEYLRRAEAAGIGWPLPAELTDAELEARLFPPRPPSSVPRPLPDWSEVHREMKERKRTGVTLQLLWLEYKEREPEGLQYSQFCELYRRWRGTLDRVLRQEHVPGDKTFVDYAGQTVFGGVSRLIVPDNLKSGVREACYYDPDVNPTYHDLALHYGTAVLPARKQKPRDKAKVESGVLLVERWILARLRKHTFFSLAELNREIRRLLEWLNDRPFQKLKGTRRSLLESLERPALLPLPERPYEFARWKKARVNIDYHVVVEGHYYSVPHGLTGEQVDVRITASMVEVLHSGRRVAAHPRSERQGGFTTEPSHRPKSHQKYLEWTPSRIIAWAERTGPRTGELARRILESRPAPGAGLPRLPRPDAVGREALLPTTGGRLRPGAPHQRPLVPVGQVHSGQGLDQMPVEEQTTLALPQDHENVRGSAYYAFLKNGAIEY